MNVRGIEWYSWLGQHIHMHARLETNRNSSSSSRNKRVKSTMKLVTHGEEKGEVLTIVRMRWASPRWFSSFAGIRIHHPPARLASALILNTDELAVKRQVVPNRILKNRKNYCYFTGTNFRRRLRAASNWGTTDSTFFIISAEHKMHFYQFIISVKLPGGHYKIKSIHLIEDLLSHYLLWHGIYFKTRAECILN